MVPLDFATEGCCEAENAEVFIIAKEGALFFGKYYIYPFPNKRAALNLAKTWWVCWVAFDKTGHEVDHGGIGFSFNTCRQKFMRWMSKFQQKNDSTRSSNSACNIVVMAPSITGIIDIGIIECAVDGCKMDFKDQNITDIPGNLEFTLNKQFEFLDDPEKKLCILKSLTQVTEVQMVKTFDGFYNQLQVKYPVFSLNSFVYLLRLVEREDMLLILHNYFHK